MQLTLSMAIMQVITCCIFAGFEVVLSVTGMLVDLSVTVMQVTVSVAIMWLEVSAANIWMTIFIIIRQMGVSVAIMQVVFSRVHYAHDCVHFNYAGVSFFYSYVGDRSK